MMRMQSSPARRFSSWVAAIPLIVACATGLPLAFYQEVEHAAHPERFQLEVTGAPMSTGEALERLYRSAYVLYAKLPPLLDGDSKADVPLHHAQWRALLRPTTRALLLESIPNPTKDLSDIRAVADLAHTHGLPLVVDNTLARQFDVDAPDTAWVTDITYLATATGWVYLAVVLDLFSRKVVGWAMSSSRTT